MWACPGTYVISIISPLLFAPFWVTTNMTRTSSITIVVGTLLKALLPQVVDPAPASAPFWSLAVPVSKQEHE